MTDDELYRRAAATLVASWAAYARGSEGATVRRLEGVAVAVFPHGPERGVYNNALLERDVADRARTIAAMEAAYGDIPFAAWVHESDEGMRAELTQRGYTIAETSRTMGLVLNGLNTPGYVHELERIDWKAYLSYLFASGLPEGLLAGANPTEFHALGARLDRGPLVATALAFDHAGDCGIENVGTLKPARRRGLATALTSRHLHDARARGCRTATLQSTEMGERVYAGVGFRDLGRFLEFVR